MNPHHEENMRQCLTLAESGKGNIGNGALVGALLVLENNIIAQGFHSKYGGLHAERSLLESYRDVIPPDAILYVNLEPCCHHGKTPPCTEILIERGVKRVCYGMLDPDPRVAGKGIDILRRAGVETIGPVCRASCEYLNRGFASVRTRGRPWITLKKAQMRDGRIANGDGSPLKITTDEQDIWTHSFLRARHDAILVGVQTIVNDDPILNTRLAQVSSLATGLHKNYRIILDPHLRCPEGAKVIRDDMADHTIIVTASPEENEGLTRHGARILRIPVESDTFVWDALWEQLLLPTGSFGGITSILVEGGARTWQAFHDAHLVDEEVTLVGA